MSAAGKVELVISGMIPSVFDACSIALSSLCHLIWQVVLLQTELEFSRCLSLRGFRMSYFSQEPDELSLSMQIAGSNFFVETKLNSNSIVKRSRELIRLFGYKENDLEVITE